MQESEVQYGMHDACASQLCTPLPVQGECPAWA